MRVMDEESPLVKAVNDGDILQVAILLSKGKSPRDTDNDGCTLLHLAIRANSLAIIELLIIYGAEVNVMSKGKTLIKRVVEKKNMEMIGAFLEAGARVDGVTLFHAVRDGDPTMLKLILEYYYETESLNKLLISARKYKHSECEKLIREHIRKRVTQDSPSDSFIMSLIAPLIYILDRLLPAFCELCDGYSQAI